MIPIINITIRASIRVFADQNARENAEILKKSIKLKTEFDKKLKENMSEYAAKYVKNITSAYKEVEIAFRKIIEIFACYDIMNNYIDKAQLKVENRKYCKMIY